MKEIIGYKCKKAFPGTPVDTIFRKKDTGTFTRDDIPEDLYNVSFFFDEFFDPIYKEAKFKVGDTIFLEGTSDPSDVIHIIESIEEESDTMLYWNDGHSWDIDAISIATPERVAEFEECQKLAIGSHLPVFTKEDKISFGCQNFTIAELEIAMRLVTWPIEGSLSIRGVKITGEFIEKLINKKQITKNK